MALYTNELVRILQKTPSTRRQFCGVLPLDKLPLRKVHRPCSFIINTHESDQPGEHWFAIYVPIHGPIEYFDSYGSPPYHERVYDFFNINKSRFIFNDERIQSNWSSNCGKYTSIYLHFRAKGYSMKQYLKFFNTFDLQLNDKFVNILYKKIMKQK